MHDTAMHIGSLLFETYCNIPSPAILEIGSSDVNGSLRDVAPAQSRYVGIDFEAGAGVDIVTTAGAPLSVEDASFDFALASSVFEHDPAFWNSFVEMVRKVRPGGIVYINVPSNGAIHRYPEDHWRFYPDSGKALARWAVSQGQPIELVESFVAPRDADIWNDFVAVFRKGPTRRRPPGILLYQKVPGAMNIQVGRAKAFLNHVARTEDMELVAIAQASAVEHAQRVAAHEAAVAQSAADMTECQARLAQGEARELQQRQDFETRAERAQWDLIAKDAEIAHARELLDVANRMLATRESEARSLTAAMIVAGRKTFAIAEERAEALSAVRTAQSERDASRRECTAERDRAVRIESGLAAALEALEQVRSDAALAALAATGRIERVLAEAATERDHADQSEAGLRATIETLDQVRIDAALRDREMGLQLAQAHDDAEQLRVALARQSHEAREQLDRLNGAGVELRLMAVFLADAREQVDELHGEVANGARKAEDEGAARDVAERGMAIARAIYAMNEGAPWWWRFSTERWRARRIARRLWRESLFDGEAYLRQNPDVAAQAMDPARHLLLHGIAEGRRF
ncbi:MAG: methyltransferase domain-containing protein [Ramlibacter sp.]|nr:methyltransferase domain-containing protein [Ramlibacter sp.]